MLVSKEKYNDAISALKEAELEQKLTAEKLSAAQTQIDELLARPVQNTEDLNATIQQLSERNAELVEKHESLSIENTELFAKLEKAESIAAELKQTISTLNTRAADPGAAAVSSTDAVVNPESINDFMKSNRDNPSSCIDRLVEEGF